MVQTIWTGGSKGQRKTTRLAGEGGFGFGGDGEGEVVVGPPFGLVGGGVFGGVGGALDEFVFQFGAGLDADVGGPDVALVPREGDGAKDVPFAEVGVGADDELVVAHAGVVGDGEADGDAPGGGGGGGEREKKREKGDVRSFHWIR